MQEIGQIVCAHSHHPQLRDVGLWVTLWRGGGGLPPWGELNETINKSINSSIKLLKSTNSLCKKKKKGETRLRTYTLSL